MKKNAIFIFGVLVISILVAVFVCRAYILMANVLWDEASFLLWGERIYESLRHGNSMDLIRLTREQFYYPPLQSWILAVPLYLVGYSVFNARLVSLFFYILGSLLSFFIARNLEKKRNNLTGLFASMFFISSPMMIFFSTLAMKEMMGAVFSCFCIYLYFKIREENNILFSFSVSIILILLFFIKYNFGVIMAFILIIETLISFFSLKNKFILLRNQIIIFTPFLIIIGYWIFYPDNKLASFISILKNPWSVTLGMGKLIDYLLYYPRSIFYMYSFSNVLGAHFLASLILVLLWWKNYKVRVLWLYVSVNIFLGTVHFQNMQERFIFLAIPFLFIISAFLLEKIFYMVFHFRSSAFIFGAGLGLIILFFGKVFLDLPKIPGFVYSMGSYTMRSPVFNEKGYKNKLFNYDLKTWEYKTPAGNFEKPIDVVDFVSSKIDLSKPIRVIGGFNELAPDYFEMYFNLRRPEGGINKLSYSSFIVTLEVLPTSSFYTMDYQKQNLWQIGEIRKIEADLSLRLIAKKDFTKMGVVVKVFGDKKL